MFDTHICQKMSTTRPKGGCGAFNNASELGIGVQLRVLPLTVTKFRLADAIDYGDKNGKTT